MLYKNYLKQDEFSSYDDFCENYKVTYPDSFNFGYDVVAEYAKTNPDKTALVWVNEDDTEQHTFNFGELDKMVNKCANFLRSEGIHKGDKVMLLLKRRHEYWLLLPALHKIGAVAIPANHLLTKKDLIYRANAVNIKCIIAWHQGRIINEISMALPESPSVKTLIMVGSEEEGWINYDKNVINQSDIYERPISTDQDTKTDDIMLMYFTSGTTGLPKVVVHNFAYPLGHIVTAVYWQQVINNGLHLTVADTGWAKAAWGKIYGQWLGGTANFVYDYERFNGVMLLKLLEKYKITTFCAPPTILRYLIHEDLDKYDLSSLKHCSTAGEPLNPEVYNSFFKSTGLEIREGFGQTETTVCVANFPWITPRLGSIGKPTPDYNVQIINENDEECDIGEEGILSFNTSKTVPTGLFVEYYGDEQITKKAWHNGFYRTGDMVWKDEDGYVWFVGRDDDLIKTSGYRVGPFEVESALIEHAAVIECAITGVPDEQRGQIIKATIVLHKNYSPCDDLIKELQEHVKKTTAPYKYPRIIEFVEELPKTVSGKIKRADIRRNSN